MPRKAIAHAPGRINQSGEGFWCARTRMPAQGLLESCYDLERTLTKQALHPVDSKASLADYLSP
jgi:hypothetical protein